MSGTRKLRRWPLAAALLAAALTAGVTFATILVRSDLTDLLPSGQSPASRVMIEQMRSGAASSLLLIGLDGAPAVDLASLSARMGETLGRSTQFRLVENGHQGLAPDTIAALFRYRYLLAPNQSADAFATPALRQDFAALLQSLQSSASPVVEQYGLPDPTGAFPAVMRVLGGGDRLRSIGGSWFAADRDRALMLAQIGASGLDFAAEDTALSEVASAFKEARDATPGAAQARLRISGPAAFAHEAAESIRADVRLLSIVSTVLVAALLLWRFRSLWVVAVIAVPLLFGAACGALAVQLCFGFVQGITLGFGMTMLGVTVDYPVLLIGHRKRGEAAPATLRRIGPAFNLAVLTASLGLTGMIFARFPGLSQLGVFSVAGILAAAAVTRLLLPRLIVAAELAPVGAGDPAGLLRLEQLRAARLPVLGLIAAAAFYLAVTGGPAWDGDLAHLSPVPTSSIALDDELRAELGAPETSQVLVIEGRTAEDVLEREEAAQPILQTLIHDGLLSGADAACLLLPSQRIQRARQAILPDSAILARRVRDAASDLGFSQTAFQPFLDDVAASRVLAPLAPGMLPASLAQDRVLQARLGALLFQRGDAWFGVIAPRALRDPARLASAFAGQDGVTYVDVHAQTNAIASRYTRQALPWLLGGVAAALLALAASLRNTNRLLRVTGSIAATLVVTCATLELAGASLTLVHLMALQFVAGIGADYALFFSRTGLDEEERMRTLRTLLTCNAMALLTFGLLCLCHTPLLKHIGVTVALGVAAAMVLAFLFAGPYRQGDEPA
jgi:predicted exporter